MPIKRRKLLIATIQIALLIGFAACDHGTDKDFTNFIVDPREANLEFYWRDDQGNAFRSIENLKKYVESRGRRLRFAMNGGMYQKENKPLGLFIQNGKTLTPLNTGDGEGNFYLQPNGVFYIRKDKRAFVVPTRDFQDDGEILYATQSGPMLVVEGEINPKFAAGSQNLNIRNGVCVMPDNRIVFAISRREVNFYDFAAHFKSSGCRNALYLDGFVSRMYAPEQNIMQTDGDFGVIISVVE